jgi:hypothetical protein
MVITGKSPGTSGTPSSQIGNSHAENTLAVAERSLERAFQLLKLELENTRDATKRLEKLVKLLKNKEGGYLR